MKRLYFAFVLLFVSTISIAQSAVDRKQVLEEMMLANQYFMDKIFEEL